MWSYGKGDLGELGNEENKDINYPVQVKTLENIKQISSGYSHTVALSKEGNIYTWGANTKGQLGDGSNTNSNKPIKIEGITDIIKVQAVKDITLALDETGNIYAWGEGYSSLPMKLITSKKFADISGSVALSQEGFIYNLVNLEERANILSQIAKISGGLDHQLALSVNGYVYSWGENNANGEQIITFAKLIEAH